MNLLELIFLSVGLSMDAFAVSVCKGLAIRKVTLKDSVICGLWFGGFQALMPMLGYLLGSSFEKYINSIAPWVAFGLLALIGGNMIRESFKKDEESADAGLDFRTMLLMAIATSIDALAVGITFACVPVVLISSVNALINTTVAVLIVGITTFLLSGIGVRVGNVFGIRYKSKAEFVGGLILVLIGIKILLEHFQVI